MTDQQKETIKPAVLKLLYEIKLNRVYPSQALEEIIQIIDYAEKNNS